MSATDTGNGTASKPTRRFPPPCWTQDEALALIQAYRDRWYALRRGYLRTADWDAVAEDLGRISPGASPPKTSAQCRHKMEKLRQRYRAEKQRALAVPDGRFISTWLYFDAMDSMENNGSVNGINSGEDTPSGNLKIVNYKSNNQSGLGMDSGLNPGRGIRFKPALFDNNSVTVASRSNHVRVSHSPNYLQEEDEEEEENNDNEFDDGYYIQTPPVNKNLGKGHKFVSQSYGTRLQSPDNVNYHDSGVRARKFSKTGSSNLNSNQSYLNERSLYGERLDRNASDRRGVKRDSSDSSDSIGQIVSSIKVLADGFVKMEKMKMDMVKEIEKMRMEADLKRNELLLESQKQIVEAFVKGLSHDKRRQQ
ncbi:uncharacterized protein [Rutidosis leptorrhynchoides]|uniref:uncharacterized protein n=1 Tax=Rutidosis leptorrhynchoides TaxID=125765 RepID=UPI003A99F3B0